MSIALKELDTSRRRRFERPLLSNSSILILSGFLLGMVITDFIPPAARVSAVLGASVGVIAFFSLASVSRAREAQAAARKVELKTIKLEGKVYRHVRNSGPVRRRERSRFPAIVVDRQYVTVPGCGRG